jgi:hypothetical protein
MNDSSRLRVVQCTVIITTSDGCHFAGGVVLSAHIEKELCLPVAADKT